MTSVPSYDNCIEILKKVNCSKAVIKHSIVVRNLSMKIAKKTDADHRLVEAASLLHDIGRSKTNGIYHAIEGIKIAKNLKLSNKIIKIIERHIGAGITKSEAKKIGLPPKDYIPVTIEEKIVCHADNLIDNNKKQKIEKEIEKALSAGLKDYASRLNILHKELSNICGVDLNMI